MQILNVQSKQINGIVKRQFSMSYQGIHIHAERKDDAATESFFE